MGEKKVELEKDKRIKKEKARLQKLYKEIDDKVQKTVEGLIARAAFMRVSLEDFEKDLRENGYTEMFSQSDKQEPYERKRPVADLYNSMNPAYQKIIKQLTDLLPREPPKAIDDGFEFFVAGRKDV